MTDESYKRIIERVIYTVGITLGISFILFWIG